MGYQFNGVTKVVSLTNGTTTLDLADLFSRYKEWVLESDNAKYPLAFTTVGGDPLPGDRFTGTTFFLENDWKIKPYEGSHTLTVTGNLYARDGSDPFISTTGNYNVRVMLTLSNLVDTIAGSGGGNTAEEIMDAVWSAELTTYPTNSAGKLLSTLFTHSTSILEQLADLPTAIREELETELTHLIALENGLTENQAIMLLEIYKIYGLDPTTPLVVTRTSRKAGNDIIQSISSNETRTLVVRD